jgi:PLP dependent protein
MTYITLKNDLDARGITLVAVSKTQPLERLMALYEQGQRIFGENRVQELTTKYEALPKDIEWHLIGHLQKNKVKYIAPFVQLIHSVDSLELLVEINKQAQKNNRVIDCLLQFHVAQEETKFGLDREEAVQLLESQTFITLQHVRLRGVMGMASFTDNTTQVRAEFDALMAIYQDLKTGFFSSSPDFDIRSMGMSGDWEIAAAAGSTMVRIGSLLF